MRQIIRNLSAPGLYYGGFAIRIVDLSFNLLVHGATFCFSLSLASLRSFLGMFSLPWNIIVSNPVGNLKMPILFWSTIVNRGHYPKRTTADPFKVQNV